jgi:hypothetical protein
MLALSGRREHRSQPMEAKSPQTDCIVDRLYKIMLNEFGRITFRNKIYTTINELRAALDARSRSLAAWAPRLGSRMFCGGNKKPQGERRQTQAHRY